MKLPKVSAQMLGPVLVPMAAVAVGWYGIYRPQRARLQAALADQVEEQQKTAVQRDIAAREALLRSYRERLPKTADTDWLIAQSALIAGKTGMPLTTVTPAQPIAEQGYTRLAITVESAATYHELGRFVSALESAQPFIRVDDVKVEAAMPAATGGTAAGGAPANRHKITLTLSTLYLP